MPKIEVSFLESNKKEEFFVDKNRFTIGRSNKADIVIPREELSRIHVDIDCSDENVYITDLNSLNGVFVNGKRIPQSTKILHQIIFPIEIAKTVSLFIILEDQIPNESNAKVNNKNLLNIKSDLSGETKITKEDYLNREFKHARIKNHFKKSSLKKNNNFLVITTIVLSAFIMTAYLYLSNDQTKAPDIPQKNTVKQVNEFNSSNTKYSSLNFDQMMSSNHCSDFVELCNSFDTNSENIILHKNDIGIFIFFDLGEKKSNNFHPDFEATNLSEKYKVYLSEIASNFKLLNEAKIHNKNLTVIGFTQLDGKKYFKFTGITDYKSLLEKEKNYSFIISDYYKLGKKREFNKYIKPYIIFSEL